MINKSINGLGACLVDVHLINYPSRTGAGMLFV